MKVYAVRGDYKKFAGLLYKDRRVASSFYGSVHGVTLAPEWENFEVIKGVGNDGRTTSKHPVGNFALVEGYENPTFDDMAKTALEPHIARYGEFLPLRYGSATRWLFNCLNSVAALDLGTSVVRRDTVEPYPIRDLRGPLYFKLELLVNEWIFMPAERPTQIFVTDKFVKVVEEHGLTGFEFHEIWDSAAPLPVERPARPNVPSPRDLH
jgi:hypothetical protein